MKAYILTRQKQTHHNITSYIYTGIAEDGPFLVEIDNSPILFFINRFSKLPNGFKYKERKEVLLKSFSKDDVDAIYFNNQSDLFNGKKQLKEAGVTCFESDVIAEERYLMERFIFGSVEIQGSGTKKDGLIYFKNPLMKPTDYKPDFRVLSIDIETHRDGSILSFGFHVSGRGEPLKLVIMRSLEHKNAESDDYITYYTTERNMLKAFISLFNKIDPDIIIGWHVIGFDFEFIRKRLEFLKIHFNIGRGGIVPSIRQLASKSWVCSINGRIVIDGPPTLRGAFYSFESYSLENVAKEVLGVGKDITGSGKVEEIERRFREDKRALAHYNLLDCTLVTEIYEKLGLIDLTFTRAITCGLAMDKIGMSVASFDYFMLPKVHRKGFVTPDVEDIIPMGQGSGGLVFIKEPGFYDSIIVLDFKSLYPSIIRTFFIDPVSRLLEDIEPVNTPVDVTFSRIENVLPSYLEKLMNKRAEAKKCGDEHLSQAVKILMNSFYGVMGTPGSRFYHPDLPKAITGTGQWLLTKTKELLEGDGYTVIYGDTDSLFVQLKPEERMNFDKSGEDLASYANDYLKNFLMEQFNVESILELEYEKHFRKFFLPGLRGSNTGAKKRYAGLKSTKTDEELSFTGLEFVRSDWTGVAKEFQYNLFDKIFHDKEVDTYIKDFVKSLQMGELDQLLSYKKRLTKPAKEYTKMMPPQVKAALLLDPTGSKIRRIEYVMTTQGPIPIELKPKNIDYNHYIDKQLKPIADSILPFIGKDFFTLVFNKQPELF